MRITLTNDLGEALPDSDSVFTDVRVSMGDPKDTWWSARFMRCLPAFQDENTNVGGEIMNETGMDDGLEVTDAGADSAIRP